MNYAGDLTPEEAWKRLESGATLVDVRTDAEWRVIGIPSTPQQAPSFIQWEYAGPAPGQKMPNESFLEELRAAVPVDTEVIFLCRSGVRSIAAANAATNAGYSAYNILEGFEGAVDSYGDRTINGWKNRGLPWRSWDPGETL